MANKKQKEGSAKVHKDDLIVAWLESDEGKAGIERLRRMFSGEPYLEPEEDHVEKLRRILGRESETDLVYEPMPKNFCEADKFYAHGMGIKLELDGI